MKLSRQFTLVLHFFFDQLLPPFIRDSRFIFPFAFKMLFGTEARILNRFKENAPSMSDAEYAMAYRTLAKHAVNRETDLNSACLRRILEEIRNEDVLDAGCGTGYLADLLSRRNRVTATDIHIRPELSPRFPRVTFIESFVERLPFASKAFDTVVCTHTLEHVRDPQQVVAELRRVAKRRLIIVVPQQRPYLYTFDLHLHFFPYPHSLLLALPSPDRRTCESLEGDLFYVEHLAR